MLEYLPRVSASGCFFWHFAKKTNIFSCSTFLINMERETPHCGTRVQLLPQDPSLWENESWESYFVAAYSLTKAGERNRNTENLQHHSFNKLEGWLDAEHAPPSRYQNTVEGRPEFGSPPYHQHGVEHRKPHLHNPVPKTPNYLFNCKAWKSLSVSCVELRNKLPFELNLPPKIPRNSPQTPPGPPRPL